MYKCVTNKDTMATLSNEIKTLIQRLKQCDLEKVRSNPAIMLRYYPIRNPDMENTIFDEVYGLINESLLNKTYKFRIFYFLNTFLSSTKVPAHVIAAYMKRLSRMSLEAKPRSLVAILRIVNNLLSRHPTLMFLRDRVDEKAREMEISTDTCTLRNWLASDPFVLDEIHDLKATSAMDSSIWELMPLRFHEHPSIAKEAQYLGEKSAPDMERDLDDIVR